MPKPGSTPSHARFAVAAAIAHACADFPDIGPVPLDAHALSPADRALATAIHRTTLQRWLTLEHLLNRISKQPMAKLEPNMRAVLLTGAAQLLFMPGIAAYAAVDDAVTLAAKLVRPPARGMVNAVLRKIAGLSSRIDQRETWTPGRDRLPLGGGTLHLTEPALPRPDNLVKHLAAAASHPESLVNRWIKQRGPAETTRLCVHNLQNPPTILVAPRAAAVAPADAENWTAHDAPGFIVWTGPHEAMRAFLSDDPQNRRVQDPSSYAACHAAADLQPRVIIDYCAGLGTKTRQLAVMHPDARIIATDVSEARRTALADLPAIYPNVQVVEPHEALRQRCDLLLLDVPCTNSGVLARRPEARYRLTSQSLGDLVGLQREIIDQSLPTAAGHILYATCSIEAQENEQQAAWLVQRAGGTLVTQGAILPGGRDASYHDGSYHALVRL